MARDVVQQPPLEQHCWVWSPGARRGDPVPGVIVSWHLLPRPDGAMSGWLLQVALQRAPGNLCLDWFEAYRVSSVRDRMPIKDGQQARRGCQHVWVRHESKHGPLAPTAGLVMSWRRGESEWEAQVAQTHQRGSLFVDWVSVRLVVPVADDRWSEPRESLPSFPK